MNSGLNTISYKGLLAYAGNPEDDLTRTFAAVIQSVSTGHIQPPNQGMGLPLNKFIELLDSYFPGSSQKICGGDFQRDYAAHVSPLADEFVDMVGLLLEHRSSDAEYNVWLAHAIASGCMGSDHLYHDMGLPNRAMLSGLLERYFTTLFQKNVHNMKWKKFFYKQLCDRAEVLMCPARNCQSCVDYKNCYSSEETVSVPVMEAAIS